MAKETIINVQRPKLNNATITITGTSDLVLNKMNARAIRMLLADDRKKVREVPNVWEDLCTSVHWRDPLPCEDTYRDIDEDFMKKMLKENAPCITAFGLKKSIGQAVVRNEIDKYSTKIDAALNISAAKGLVPVRFSSWAVDERLMSPKKGAPVVVRLNHFLGWEADFDIQFAENVFTLEGLVNIINLAGFGLGIGSGRTSGYGRYEVTNVK